MIPIGFGRPPTVVFAPLFDHLRQITGVVTGRQAAGKRPTPGADLLTAGGSPPPERLPCLKPGTEPTTSDLYHPNGFTMWLAGGGVKGGLAYGATDEFGFRAVENRVSVHDLHATLLHLLGFDHERLTYRYSGRDFRLTDVHGEVVQELLV